MTPIAAPELCMMRVKMEPAITPSGTDSRLFRNARNEAFDRAHVNEPDIVSIPKKIN